MTDPREVRGYLSMPLDWPEIESDTRTEGQISFRIAASKSIYDAPAFFNPVMVANRDLAMLFTKVYSEKMNLIMRVFEPLAGIGVRAFRLVTELPDKISEVVIADYNPVTTAIASQNIQDLGIGDKVLQFQREARSLALDMAEHKLSFHYVDLDPFGSPSPFIDTMWPILTYRSMIAVTATDMTALCGVFPKACLRKYGGLPVNNHHTHDTAARLLIAMVVKSAARFEKGVVPVFTASVDHYTKIFFTSRTSRGAANDAVAQLGFSFTCQKCHQIQYTAIDEEKPDCCGMLEQAGPLWIGKIYETEWCKDALDTLDSMDLKSSKRLTKMLQEGVDAGELRGYYQISKLCKL